LLRLVKGTTQSQTNSSSTGIDFVLMILDEEKPKHAAVWQNGFVPGIFAHRVLSLAKRHSIAEHHTCC
jgi:hypothetical protein